MATRTSSRIPAWITIAAALLASRAYSQYASADARLASSMPLAQANLGRSVSVAGDVLAVGAPGESSQGSVYVWRRVQDAWSYETTLVGSDESPYADFGVVSVSGGTIAVGAPAQSTNGTVGGAVYVYTWDGSAWSEQQKIVASDLEQDARFGGSVALSGDTLVVGAPGATGAVAGTGAAYVFARSGTTWTQQVKLFALDGADQDVFGNSISLSGSTIVVGSPRDSTAAPLEGSVHVFVGSGSSWVHEEKLTASDGSEDDDFGVSVSVDADRLVVGADTAGPSASDESGAVYVYDRSAGSWNETARLQAQFRGPFDRFGCSVDVEGDVLLVGARQEGAAYLFELYGGTWHARERLDTGSSTYEFGASVSRDGALLVAGAPDENGGPWASSAGGVYTYRFGTSFDALCFGDGTGTPCPCANTSPLGQGCGCTHSGGKGGRLFVGGVPSIAADSVVLYAYDLKSTSALYFQGSSQVNFGLGAVYGDGLRCAGGTIRRLATIATQGNGTSNCPDAAHPTAISVRGLVAAGQVKTYQVLFRDNTTFCTPDRFNLTNGILVVWGP